MPSEVAVIAVAAEVAQEMEVAEPLREAGVGLMFVVAPAPKMGWAVKTVIKRSPADLSGSIQEGHVLTGACGCVWVWVLVYCCGCGGGSVCGGGGGGGGGREREREGESVCVRVYACVCVCVHVCLCV